MSDKVPEEPTKDDLKIKAACGNAPWYVIKCPKCVPPRVADEVDDGVGRFPWVLGLKCRKCHMNWYVCKECSAQKYHMFDAGGQCRHQQTRHKDPEPPQPIESSSSDDSSVKEEIITEHISRSASSKFFEENRNGDGTAYLVATAVYGKGSYADRIDKDDINTFMTTCHFVSRISRPQRNELADLLQKVCTTTEKHNENDSDDEKPRPAKRLKKSMKKSALKVRIMTTPQQIRSTVIEGKNSLYNNLPHPNVKTCGGHAYILPSEALADFLAHGLHGPSTRESNLHPVQQLSCSQAANEHRNQLQHKRIEVFGGLWSDGFEPNYTVGNRGSAWIMTMTLETKDVKGITLKHVYPIAIGKEDDDHRGVEDVLWKDIKAITGEKRFYDGRSKRNQEVAFHLLTITGDQPERRSENGLLRGNSIHHARWGYSVNLHQIEEKLKPCQECLTAMQVAVGDVLWEKRTCDQCLNWMIHETEGIYFDPPKNYPEEEVTPNGIPATRLQYHHLKEAAAKAHEKIISGEWKDHNAKSYLKIWCINPKLQKEIISCAKNCKAFLDAQEDNNQEILAAIEFQREREPKNYSQWEPPPIWSSGLDIMRSHEAGMHELFLGVVNTIVFSIQDWASLRGKYQSLKRQLEKMTLPLEKKHLNWCRIQAYRGEKLGGWISENYLAFARVLPWMYSNLPYLTDDADYVEPNKPYQKWTKLENSEWLRVRRLPRTGNAQVLRTRVSEHRTIGTPIAPPIGGTLAETREMVMSLWAMICQLMGMENSDEKTTDVTSRLIRIFLTKVHVHAKSIFTKEDKKPLWLKHYNFVCLLNLPDQIRELGPIRNRWEGGLRGEKFLRKVKPVVQSIKRKNWQQNLLLNILRQRELLVLKETSEEEEKENDIDDDSSEEDHEDTQYVNNTFFDNNSISAYLCHSDFVRAHGEGESLSGFYGTVGDSAEPGIFCCFKLSRRICIERLKKCGAPKYSFGMWYHQFKVKQEGDEDYYDRAPEISAAKMMFYVLLLPLLHHHGEAAADGAAVKYYTAISSGWKIMSDDGSWVFPHNYIQQEYS